MVRMVRHGTPVVVTLRSGAVVGVRRGMEFPDDDPIVVEFPWLFVAPVERATAEPGALRPSVRVRR